MERASVNCASPTPEQIRKAVLQLNDSKPDYAPILDFYSEIFVAQEQSRATLHFEPTRPSEEMVRLKTSEGFPLIDISAFQLDIDAGSILLSSLCRLAQSIGGTVGPAAGNLLKALHNQSVSPRDLFFGLLEKEGFDLGEMARTAGIDAEPAAFLTYHSIRPSLVHCAGHLAEAIDLNKWKRGSCPVCGSPPVLSVLRDLGERHLICSFCWYEWPTPRLFCPFCETNTSGSHHHFTEQDRPGCRVDLCNHCRKYIKTSDLREKRGLFYAPLEQISTLHLDIKAQELGYESGVGPSLPTGTP
ncbi:MAG: formate dehydrogenase accessory protein FdhE [Desulfobacterales bacterium]|jgi:FdhE protein